jgi:agmatinase
VTDPSRSGPAGGDTAVREGDAAAGGSHAAGTAPRSVSDEEHVGPVDATVVPRFAGPPTFARLPRLDEVERADVAILGVPFDAGVSYRPGARFGPAHIRAASRLLRPYHPALEVAPFGDQQVVDAGDLGVNPFDLD